MSKEIELLGGLAARKGGGFQTGYSVYGAEGICPTVLSHSGGYGIMTAEVKVIGQMDNSIDHTFESANRVYDEIGAMPYIVDLRRRRQTAEGHRREVRSDKRPQRAFEADA